ncbi:AIM24 family protein [Nocardia shimofusensis]|uniref:AIM24 family protein n=1 Tax=Nocardia shimofusensis TaxID=228596 RepID=UPI000832A290|nr:AIM24 family protein [Nocardia shimofusensis]
MTITVTSAAPLDVSALLLNSSGRVRADGDFVFFNQPAGHGVLYRHGRGGPDMVDVQTSALPPDIETVVVAASLDGRGAATTLAAAGGLTVTIGSDSGTLTFPITGLTTETAVVCVEIYRRAGAWKIRAVGQGYDNGLAGIATAFGVNVDDEPDSPPPPARAHPAPPPPHTPGAPRGAAPQSGDRSPGNAVPGGGYLSPPHGSPGHPPPSGVPGGRHLPPAGPGYPPAGAPGQPPPYGVPSAPPQPSHPAPPPIAPQQGALPMQSDLFDARHAEVNGLGIQKQGGKMIKVGVNGDVMARSGSMVAYQGELNFQAQGSGGIGRAIQARLTGEGVPLMKVSGRGDLFLANAAADVHLIDLDGSDGLTVNGANVLAFDSSLRFDIKRVQGAAGFASNAGLFNCVFTGRGRIALTTEGTPVVLNVDQPTYADPQAAVAWSSSLQTGIKRNDSFGLGTLLGRTTGEGLTLAFSGRGFVIVQPSELPPGGFVAGTGSGQESGQTSGFMGGLLG